MAFPVNIITYIKILFFFTVCALLVWCTGDVCTLDLGEHFIKAVFRHLIYISHMIPELVFLSLFCFLC